MTGEKITNKEVKLMIISIVVGFFFQMYLSNTIGEPIENFLFPPESNISLIPMQEPVVKSDGHYFARFQIKNSGDTELTDVHAEYNFLCSDTGYGRASLERNIIPKGELIKFDVAFEDVGLNYSCSPEAYVNLQFFVDKYGNEYCATEETKQNVCMFCFTNITIIANEIREPVKYQIMYPFSTGELDLRIGGETCLSLEKIQKLNFTEIPEKRAKFYVYSIAEYCFRGEIDLEWCKEHGYV